MQLKSLSILGLAFAGLACVEPTSVVIEPLRVINWSPSNGAFCVTTNATIYVTFSDDIEFDSLSAETLYLQDASGPVPTAIDYDAPNFTAQLIPEGALEFGSLYTVVATTSIRSKQSGALPVGLDASFVTVARAGCTPGVECQLPSDCPGEQICSNIGMCTDECVTDKDCYHGSCSLGACVPESAQDGGSPGDPGAGDPGAGDPTPGDPGTGDPSGD